MRARSSIKELRRFDSHYRHISYVAQGVEGMLLVSFEKNFVPFPTICTFLYVAQADGRVSSCLPKQNYVGSSPTIGIFLHLAQTI